MGNTWNRLHREVHLARTRTADYESNNNDSLAELPHIHNPSNALLALRDLFRSSGLDAPHLSSPEWNPLSELIRKDDKVLIKPNWVHQQNGSSCGQDCLITNTSLIRAVLEYLLLAGVGNVVIGDAPVQGCDFDSLLASLGIRELQADFEARGLSISIRDFRLINVPDGRYGKPAESTSRSAEADYVLFDVAENSELEPISGDCERFRVTMYDPKALGQTHRPGKHQYLIAGEAVEADVVINLPKLKTHKKAGMTGALKSMVGINGHKKYLPHHRKGGTGSGGDCYGGKDACKATAEQLFDIANSCNSPGVRRILFSSAAKLISLGNRIHKNGRQAEGSWYGNDTIWRTCLDIQKILHYGTREGKLSDTTQRKILTITDAIIAGEGEGPLTTTPVPLGALTLTANVAAADWVHTYLMGIDPEAIPIVRQAFEMRSHRLADFAASEIVIKADGQQMTTADLAAKFGRHFRPPAGWVGHCELRDK